MSCQGKFVCVWCEKSLFKKRTHSLPNGDERRVISLIISPRTIPDGGLVCYACWVRAGYMKGSILKQNIKIKSEPLDFRNVNVIPERTECQIVDEKIELADCQNVEPNPQSTVKVEIKCETTKDEINGVIPEAMGQNFDVIHETTDNNNIDPLSSENTNICVKCLFSLNWKRSHALPDGPERNLIASIISPREIPPWGRVCMSCWLAVQRKVKANPDDETSDKRLHQGDHCVLCDMSLFRRQTRTLPFGPERDAVQAKIFPRELPDHALLCTHCWEQIRNSVQSIDRCDTQRVSVMRLDAFKHTTSSSSSCFVPDCSNKERLTIPSKLRRQILVSKKLFITGNARICAQHKTSDNWDFLEQCEFSQEFTKTEMEAMLNLSVMEITN